MEKSKDPELRDCVVRLRDDHEIEHCVRLRATSVYEAALRDLTGVGDSVQPQLKRRCESNCSAVLNVHYWSGR
jgi:hypothetical protein